jgi:hypothetical protein
VVFKNLNTFRIENLSFPDQAVGNFAYRSKQYLAGTSATDTTAAQSLELLAA